MQSLFVSSICRSALLKPKSFLIALSLLTISGCAERDISVTSDIGERLTIKASSVTVSTYDKEKSAKFYEDTNAKFMEGYNSCVNSSGLGAERCWDIYGRNMYSEEMIKEIRQMPIMKSLQYRTIFTNINGDKIASDYKTVVCLPKGTKENRERWSEMVTVGTDISDSNKIEDIAARRLCDKFGKQ